MNITEGSTQLFKWTLTVEGSGYTGTPDSEFQRKKWKSVKKVPKSKNRPNFWSFGVIPSYLVRMEHILWKNIEKIFLMKKYFFDVKKSKFKKCFFRFLTQILRKISKIEISKFESKIEKISFSNFDFLTSKKYFFIKIFFSLFFHKICSILTKYEGITPKTPKVRSIFRFWHFFDWFSFFFLDFDSQYSQIPL